MRVLMSTICIGVATLTAAGMGFAATATLQGEYYDLGVNVSTLTEAKAAAAGSTPNLTFDTDKIDFGVAPDYYIPTVREFLNGGSANITNVVDNGVAGPSPAYDNYMGESLWHFTGTVGLVNGQDYTIMSDDGFSVVFDINGNGFEDGTVIMFDGLRAPGNATTEAFTGVTGVYAMDLYYFEGHETQAQLISNLTPAVVPIPAAAWLFGSGLLGLAAMKRKRR